MFISNRGFRKGKKESNSLNGKAKDDHYETIPNEPGTRQFNPPTEQINYSTLCHAAYEDIENLDQHQMHGTENNTSGGFTSLFTSVDEDGNVSPT